MRTELAILETKPGSWELLVRRSQTGGEWPRLWSSTYREKLSSESVSDLAKQIQDIGFFDLAPQYLDAEHADQETVTLEVSQWGRRHLVLVAGRQPKRLMDTLRALDDLVRIRLLPWPEWMMVLDRNSMSEPPLVKDLPGSLSLHRYWLSIEPDRTPLHLDLFALQVALGNKAAARLELKALAKDRTLEGLVPELEQLCR